MADTGADEAVPQVSNTDQSTFKPRTWTAPQKTEKPMELNPEKSIQRLSHAQKKGISFDPEIPEHMVRREL